MPTGKGEHRENAQAVGLEGINYIRQEMELLRDRVAGYYVTIESDKYPIVEAEVGDVLHAIRQAC